MEYKTYSYEFHKWFNCYFHLSVDGKFKGMLYLVGLLPSRQFELFMIKFDKKLRGVRGRYREEAFKTDIMKMRVYGHSITIYSY